MAAPNSRTAFKDYCLRKLGAPVIEINVADEQIDDRIDDALQKFTEYHFDGSEEKYIAYSVTASDVTNGYITVDDGIFMITEVLPSDSGIISDGGIFNVEFQMLQSDFFGSTGVYGSNGGLTDFYIMKTDLELMQRLLSAKKTFHFNRKTNRVYVKDAIKSVGEILILKAYVKLAVDTAGDQIFTDIWNDEWLKNYSTSLIKLQWGENMGKYSGVQLPGGITMNGLEIKSDAKEEIKELLEELDGLQLPVDFAVG